MVKAQPVRAHVWANGARIETVLYDEPLEGETPSDRIHLLVTDQSGVQTGWLMNVDDAIAMIDVLIKAIAKAREEVLG